MEFEIVWLLEIMNDLERDIDSDCELENEEVYDPVLEFERDWEHENG